MVLEYFCPLCQNEYQTSDEIFVTKCSHVFHQKCLHDWLHIHNTCADCHTPCTATDTLKVIIKSRDSEFVKELLKLMDENEAAMFELKLKLNEQNSSKANDDSKKESNQNDQLPKEQENNSNICKEIAERDKIINDLETKLRDKSLELEKEIRNSTLMIVEKIKLQQQLTEAKQAGVKSVPTFSVKTEEPKNQNIQQNKSKPKASGGAVRKKPVGNNENLDKAASELLKYSKKLQNIGFKFFFQQDNDIFVRENDCSPITKILSKEQVDEIMRNALKSCSSSGKSEVS